jgi:hypothetical protein
VTSSGNSVSVKVLVPAGMLGAGFTEESIERGIALGAHAIAIDGGSTDSGPYYLGAGLAKMPEEAIAADLRVLLKHGAAAGIPVIVGSAGTSGTDAGVDWVAAIVEQLARDLGIQIRLARLYSEQQADTLRRYLDQNRITPLAPSVPLTADTLERCEHIVGLLGAEPFCRALEDGADAIVAGRATDTAVLAAVPLLHGCAPGPSWHAAKTAECGGQCTTNPRGGGVIVTVDADGFTVEPLDPQSACTPTSVAAHMLYENADPYRMREPSGTLDVTDAHYEALDDRRVRVSGSRFDDEPYTMKLEGAAAVGFQSVALAGIKDPEVLANIETWSNSLRDFIVYKARAVLDLGEPNLHVEVRCYGYNAVLGELDTDTAAPREVAAMLIVTARDQETATKVTKLANPYLLHMPLPGMRELPSFAFMSSPAEIERGALYEFVLNHVVSIDRPDELCRTVITDIGDR